MTTEERINEALQMIEGARQDIKNNWGDPDARVATDMQLSVAESWLRILPNLIRYELTDAKYQGEIDGMDRLGKVYNNLQDQLQAGEGNLSR
jgi:Mg2+/citrate symporter